MTGWSVTVTLPAGRGTLPSSSSVPSGLTTPRITTVFAGMVRFGCVLLCALSLLHARAYTSQEVQAELKYQNDVYGSNFFPTLQGVQAQVFQDSLSGPLINDYLGMLLIKPTPPEHREIKRKEFTAP